MPVAGIAMTAPAVFDGYRGRCTASDAFKCHGHGTRGAVTASNNYFRVSDDWSTVTPGPIVELTETFCR